MYELVLASNINEENDIIPILNEIAKAKKEAQLQLMENGFDEKVDIFTKRKRTQKRKLVRKNKKIAKESL